MDPVNDTNQYTPITAIARSMEGFKITSEKHQQLLTIDPIITGCNNSCSNLYISKNY